MILSGTWLAACGGGATTGDHGRDGSAGAAGSGAAGQPGTAGAGGADPGTAGSGLAGMGGAGLGAAGDADAGPANDASDAPDASDAADASDATNASDVATSDAAPDADAAAGDAGGDADAGADVPVDAPAEVPPPKPQTTIPTTAIDFGDVECGTAGGGLPLTFSNTGDGPLHYRAVIAPGGLYSLMGAAADGSVSGDVAPGGSGMLTIVAGTIGTTTASGATFPGSLAVVTNAAGAENVQIPLKMTAMGGACTLTCGAFTKCTPATGAPYCANTTTDNGNCGTCGHACGAGEVCTGGACAITCGAVTTCKPTGATPYCANTSTDNDNCGTCGHACASGEVCTTGACVLTCGALTKCTPAGGAAPYCANTSTDSVNCGTCGHVCGTGEICSGGACVLSCGSLTKCTPAGGAAPYCANTSTDNHDCGTCGHACAAGQACMTGTCQNTCSALQTLCSGACTFTSFDPSNCGTCGHVCSFAHGAAACASGACALASCTAGFADCDRDAATGCEIDKNTDLANCGACGFACALGETCHAGACSADLTQNLLGYWGLDESVGSAAAIDTSGNGLNGQVQGSVTFVPGAGKKGTGAAMFGGSGFIRVVFPNDALGSGTGLFIPQGNITFSMWFKTTSASVGGLQVVEGPPSHAGCDRVIGNGAGNTLSFNTWNEVNMSEPFVVNDGVWHQVVYVLDKTLGFKAYIDGVLEASSATATGNCGVGCSGFNWAEEYWIGRSAGCRFGADYFTGLIDDVRIYSYPLPPSTVTQLYNATK